jgi:hypothetical protein
MLKFVFGIVALFFVLALVKAIFDGIMRGAKKVFETSIGCLVLLFIIGGVIALVMYIVDR